MISVEAFSIKHWLMKIRLMFFFFPHTTSFTLLSVSGKWDKEENIAKTFLRRSNGRTEFSTAEGREGGDRSLSSTCEFCFHLKKFAFRVLFLKCAKIYAFLTKMIFISFHMIPYRDAVESQTQINNPDSFKFVFSIIHWYSSTSFLQLTIILESDRRRQKSNNRQQTFKWKTANERLSLDTLKSEGFLKT